jgi:hypothetical protein
MLHHHDNRPYELAAQEAADRARQRLDALIQRGRARAGQVIETVMNTRPVDRIVRGGVVEFHATGQAIEVGLGDVRERLHDHALAQAATRVGLPQTYVAHLRDNDHAPWGAELLAHNLRLLYARLLGETRLLSRSVDGEVRAVLSDRFRRMDSRPIVDSFAKACAAVGALPVEGYATDVKVAIKAVLPQIFEPVPNEVMAYGIILENSDFGAAALSLRTFALRLWCSNYAITDESLREVHLGARLADDIAWSSETHRLDTARTSSAIGDVVRAELDAGRLDELQAVIRRADAERVDARAVGMLLRKHLNRAEARRATEAFNGPDVELLPAGSSVCRVSNAVSWLAGQTADTTRKLELMRAAGAVLSAAG